ncbi:uncharacterized protein N7500_010988, partial [Penicillium coprophilum]|uniref:uncharacterized protein n=1 Tax=Penicillium coprophilum TaxID=36646 RepID=UPI0023886D9B
DLVSRYGTPLFLVAELYNNPPQVDTQPVSSAFVPPRPRHTFLVLPPLFFSRPLPLPRESPTLRDVEAEFEL